jgi:hypothetical protein
MGCSWAFDVMYQWDFMVAYNGDGMGYNLHLRGMSGSFAGFTNLDFGI